MLTLCMAEDRLEDTSLRLALLSLRAQCPDVPLTLFRPDPSPEFRAWLQGFPQVTLADARLPDATHWNCKPQALLRLLDEGKEEVLWLDSDLAFTRPFTYLFDGLSPDTIVVAEDLRFALPQGTLKRTQGWNFPVGKTYPATVNSCVLRVTPRHRTLLVRWLEMMATPQYQEAQTKWVGERPFYLRSDQDLLNALLGSQEFSDLPVRFLECGRDLIHCSGWGRSYSTRERLRGLFSPIAPILHNPSQKASEALDLSAAANPPTTSAERLFLEISPYLTLARRYEADLAPQTAWLRYRTTLGSLLRALGCGHYALPGLPLIIPLSIRKAIQHVFRRAVTKIRTAVGTGRTASPPSSEERMIATTVSQDKA